MTQTTALPVYKQNEQDQLLSGVAYQLADLGAYDEAIATMQLISLRNRPQNYLTVVAQEIVHNNRAAVARMVPVVVKASKVLDGSNGPPEIMRTVSVHTLYVLTRSLAQSGYQDIALEPYHELQTMIGGPSAIRGPNLAPADIAELQMLMGDVEGAFVTADRAGPLTEKAGAASAAFYLALVTGGKPPTAGQVVSAASLANRERPGPGAQALRIVALTLAGRDDLEGARRAEAGLESGPSDVLTGVRDDALGAIADAQIRGGNLRDAFATARRIIQPDVRLKPLLAMVATPPQP